MTPRLSAHYKFRSSGPTLDRRASNPNLARDRPLAFSASTSRSRGVSISLRIPIRQRESSGPQKAAGENRIWAAEVGLRDRGGRLGPGPALRSGGRRRERHLLAWRPPRQARSAALFWAICSCWRRVVLRCAARISSVDARGASWPRRIDGSYSHGRRLRRRTDDSTHPVRARLPACPLRHRRRTCQPAWRRHR